MRSSTSGFFAAITLAAVARHVGGNAVVEDFENPAEATGLPKGFAPAVAVEPGLPGNPAPAGKLAKWAVVEEPSRHGKRVLKLVESKNRNSVYNLFLRDEKSPADLSVSVRLRADSGNEDRGGGLIWRMVDEQNYYLARWNPLEKTVAVYRTVKGRRITLQFVPVAGVSGEWHSLKVTMKGRVISIEFDDAKAMSLPDDTWKEAGRVGLWTRSDARSSFDDLAIAPVE
ncbi:MAG TPA: hypothetical protein VFG37_02425 [Planctomycetota bacterium]|jgi:hypothetical protein|nr:hypothetical protein [Planctomycetota bacterium]